MTRREATIVSALISKCWACQMACEEGREGDDRPDHHFQNGNNHSERED